MKKNILLFVCVPYTDANPEVIRERVQIAAKYCAQRIKEGYVAFSPVLYRHALPLISGVPTNIGSKAWDDFCEIMLCKADEVVVLCLNGWDKSNGISNELEKSRALSKLITYVELRWME